MVINSKKGKGRNSLNFDLNLVPFIDILSTCICFLLITAVFLQLGTVNVRQAVGDAPSASQQKDPPSLWLQMQNNGDIHFAIKNNGKNNRDFLVGNRDRQPNWPEIVRTLGSVNTKFPTVKIALIMPNSHSRYADIVQMMDEIKKGTIPQVGISPL